MLITFDNNYGEVNLPIECCGQVRVFCLFTCISWFPITNSFSIETTAQTLLYTIPPRMISPVHPIHVVTLHALPGIVLSQIYIQFVRICESIINFVYGFIIIIISSNNQHSNLGLCTNAISISSPYNKPLLLYVSIL